MTNKQPFARQAAKASWIIPLLSLAIMVIGKSATKSPTGSLILGGLVILLFIVGILFGIICLFGIKSYGRKGILLPGITGILLNSVLLTLLLLVVFSAYKSAASWKEVYSDEGSYTILMPGNPQEQSQVANTEIGSIETHFFFVQQGDTEFFVTYTEYPYSYIQNNNSDDILDRARELSVTNLGGLLLKEEHLILLDKFPGRELTIDIPKRAFMSRIRVFLVNNKLYQLAVSFPQEKEQTVSADVEKFFDYFNLSNQ